MLDADDPHPFTALRFAAEHGQHDPVRYTMRKARATSYCTQSLGEAILRPAAFRRYCNDIGIYACNRDGNGRRPHRQCRISKNQVAAGNSGKTALSSRSQRASSAEPFRLLGAKLPIHRSREFPPREQGICTRHQGKFISFFIHRCPRYDAVA
jgi:hypothetical protein